MTAETFKQLAFAIAIGAGTIGPGIGIGLIGSAGVQAIGRNPQAENKIRASAILFIAFAEALAIFALVVGFIINFV
ncbi:MAG: ATP synthase F0 subunit C [bacterium]